MAPAISILMPVYNASRIVGQTIESVLGQTFKNFELICIDDESSDETVQIVKTYAEKDSRVVVLEKKNGGTAALSVIHAIPYVRGEYYFFTSHDDIFSSDLLDEMWRKVEETGADCIIPDTLLYFGENSPKNRMLGIRDKTLLMSGREAFIRSLDWSIAGNGLHRTSILKAFGYNYFGFSSDEYLVRVSFLNAKKVAFSKGVFYYRQVENSITRRISPLIFEHLITELKLFKLVQENNFEDEILFKRYKALVAAFIHYSYLYMDNKKQLSQVQRQAIRQLIKKVRVQFAKDNTIPLLYKSESKIDLGLTINSFLNKVVLFDPLYYGILRIKRSIKGGIKE